MEILGVPLGLCSKFETRGKANGKGEKKKKEKKKKFKYHINLTGANTLHFNINTPYEKMNSNFMCYFLSVTTYNDKFM